MKEAVNFFTNSASTFTSTWTFSGRFSDTRLPEKEMSYSKLKDQGITDEEHAHAQRELGCWRRMVDGAVMLDEYRVQEKKERFWKEVLQAHE